MSLPSQMKAVRHFGKGYVEFVTDASVPSFGDDYILVKNSAVALNPTDWKHAAHQLGDEFNQLVGCDYAGTIVAVGPKVTRDLKVGDRVAGSIHGCKKEDKDSGAFGEYVKAKGDVQIRIPDRLSFEEAATIGVGITTVGQSMYQKLQLSWPNKPVTDKTPVLVYGASTATGLFGVQYAKLSGYFVIGVCSERNFDKVKSLGVDAVFDYKDIAKSAKAIKDLTKDSLVYAADYVAEPSSAQFCADALTSKSGVAKYAAILPVKCPRDDVDSFFTAAYTSYNEPFTLPGFDTMPAKPEDFEFQRDWWTLAAELLEQGRLKPIEPTVRSGGLSGVPDGLQDLKNNKVSGQKLVYRVSETP